MTNGVPTEILLAEDNPEHAEIALHAFRQHRLLNRVHVVSDGAEALDWVFCRGLHSARVRSGTELVLLDLALPEVSGLDVLGRIKSDIQTKSLPVVILTASSATEDIKESFRLGADAYLVKPITFSAFLDTVRQLGIDWMMLSGADADTDE